MQMLPPRHAGPRRRQAGFTITEVVFATFVMALGVATSIITMQAGFKQMDLARGTTIVAQILESKMESLRMMSWTTICANVGTTTFDGADGFTSNTAIVGKYHGTLTISDDPTNSEIKNITVSINWSTYDGRSHTRSFTAIYAKNGLYDYYYALAHPS